MKRSNYLPLLGLMGAISLLAGGCLIKPARAPTRQFILAPDLAAEHALATPRQFSVEIGPVKMPGYLLRDSMVVRKSANEVQYLENALWAERLNQCFRRTLSDNLSSLLASDQIQHSASEHDRVVVRVSVDVQQFDVDIQGRGTLIAWWRVSLPDSEKPVKSGLAHLTRPGPPPLGNPQTIATALSALTADFSRELAQAIRGSATTRP